MVMVGPSFPFNNSTSKQAMDRANSGRNSALGSYETSLHDNGSRLGRCRGEPVHQISRPCRDAVAADCEGQCPRDS